MKKKGVVLLLGLIILIGGWWMTRRGGPARPAAGVLDVWATWGDDADRLQALLDSYSQAGGLPFRVTTRVRERNLADALAGEAPPDLVILSSAGPVGAYHEQGLLEPLDGHVVSAGMDLEAFYPAPLAACRPREGITVCLPWGGDVMLLY